jgi:hypothetical protein
MDRNFDRKLAEAWAEAGRGAGRDCALLGASNCAGAGQLPALSGVSACEIYVDGLMASTFFWSAAVMLEWTAPLPLVAD